MSQQQKIPKPITQANLRAAALRYLDRFSASKAHLQTVLWRRVDKAAYHHETDREEVTRWMMKLIESLEDAGFLNDARYAEARALALHRRGSSKRVIEQKLMQKGISDRDIRAALAHIAEELEGENTEWIAACALAKRRRLGPWRDADKRQERRDKDLAALARAGFSFDIATAVIDADLEAVQDFITL